MSIGIFVGRPDCPGPGGVVERVKDRDVENSMGGIILGRIKSLWVSNCSRTPDDETALCVGGAWSFWALSWEDFFRDNVR